MKIEFVADNKARCIVSLTLIFGLTEWIYFYITCSLVSSIEIRDTQIVGTCVTLHDLIHDCKNEAEKKIYRRIHTVCELIITYATN